MGSFSLAKFGIVPDGVVCVMFIIEMHMRVMGAVGERAKVGRSGKVGATQTVEGHSLLLGTCRSKVRTSGGEQNSRQNEDEVLLPRTVSLCRKTIAGLSQVSTEKGSQTKSGPYAQKHSKRLSRSKVES